MPPPASTSARAHSMAKNDRDDTANDDYINNKCCVAHLSSMQTKLHIIDICACLYLSESKDEDNNYKKQKSP
jgi:hypothetical protein